MNILITGASRGIGAAISRKIAENEVQKLFLLSRSEKLLNGLAEELNRINPDLKAFVLAYDLSQREGLNAAIEAIGRETDHLDILINNAGTVVVKDFETFEEGEIMNQFEVNYFAPARLISGLVPFLKKGNNSHVVNISSMAGFQGSVKFPGLSHYAASKAAIASLTEVLAAEYKGKISFNALCIGAVQTEMLEKAFPGFQAPLTADEMGRFIADFALNNHKYMNGKVVPVAFANP